MTTETDVGAWERHPRFTMADWAQQVANDETDAGYAAFVVASCEAMGEPMPPSFLEDAQRQLDVLAACDDELTDADREAMDQAYPRSDWEYEVGNEDTRVGFRLWQIGQRDAHQE